MPRPPRLHVKGVLYYVTQQGAHDQPLFRSEADTAHYLELLRQYKIKHRFNLFAYSLLPERIALLIEPLSETTISEIMRDLTSRYSKYYNSEYGGNGPLFKGRFRTSIAEKETNLGLLVRFLHSQPAMAAGTGNTNPVWASSRDFFSPEAGTQALPMKEAMHTELEELEFHLREAGSSRDALLEFMQASEMGTVEEQLSKPFMGSAGFVRRVQQEFSETSPSKKEAETSVSTAVAERPPRRGGWGVLFTFVIAAAGGIYLTAQNSEMFLAKQTAAVETQSTFIDENPFEPAELSTEPVEMKVAPLAGASRIVLNGSSWDVKIIPMEKGEKVSVEHDSLVFSDNKFASRLMAEKGFSATNYNMTVNPDGKITWETMQRSGSGEIVSWRGEWQGKEMKGVLSSRFTNGEVKNFYFSGVMTGGKSS